jgi:2-keto-4-pentenoate hydratase
MNGEPHDSPTPDRVAKDESSIAAAPPWTFETLVARLVGARRGGPHIAAERILGAVKDADTAYRVQAAVDAALWPDASPSAWKAGADSRDSLPTAAPIVPALVFTSGASVPAAAFTTRIVEAEVAYRFGRDLPPRDTPYSGDEVADAIAALHVAIEVVDSRIVDFAAAPALAKLADHLVNGALIIGSGTERWKRIDLRRQKATLSIDGRRVQAVEGSHGLGNPAVLLPWFAAHLGRLPTRDADGHEGPPRGVREGDVVTTGSWTRVVEAKAKQRVDVVFDGIGEASVTFTA